MSRCKPFWARGATRVVPTGVEDRKAREQRLALWQGIGLDLINLAAFFVPGLGTVMLAATAAQLLDDAVVGLDEWRHDERVEALRHVHDLVSTLALTALVGGAAATLRPSALVSGLLPVVDETGGMRLLNRPAGNFRR